MKLLVIDCAALGYELWEKYSTSPVWHTLEYMPVDTVFPAVTCTTQASFRTASLPSSHGMIANGLFNRELRKTFFWEQSSTLYNGERIWSNFRKNGGTVGQLCWQQSIGTDSDILLSPAPIHKHHGGMIQDFYARPKNLYIDICKKLGKKFNLFSYWGPFTSKKSTEWITDAICEMLNSKCAADFQLAYIPHLDYALQKYGPDSLEAKTSFKILERQLEKIAHFAKNAKYELIIFGDYAIEKAEQVLFPNRILRDAGFFSVRKVKNMEYPDIYASKAFAMVDHQVTHIYIPDKDDIEKVSKLFKTIQGVRNIYTQSTPGYIANNASGELILEAEPGFWFAYPWWENKSSQPEYASHVDIHSKPGFDPCELFLELWPPMSISTNTSKVEGTHGLTDKPVFWGSTIKTDKISTIIDAALFLKSLLNNNKPPLLNKKLHQYYSCSDYKDCTE